jgi:hypothetical protein
MSGLGCYGCGKHMAVTRIVGHGRHMTHPRPIGQTGIGEGLVHLPEDVIESGDRTFFGRATALGQSYAVTADFIFYLRLPDGSEHGSVSTAEKQVPKPRRNEDARVEDGDGVRRLWHLAEA